MQHRFHSRLVALSVICFAIMICFSSYTAGQDDEGFGQPEAPPAAAGAADDGNGAAEPRKSWLAWAYGALGPVYSLVFLALSFTLVALLVMNLLTARRDNVCPQELVDGFEAKLNEKAYQDAYNLAKADESFLGQVLSAGLEKLQTRAPRRWR